MSITTIREKIHYGNFINFRVGILPALDAASLAEFMAQSPYPPADYQSEMGQRQVRRTLRGLEENGRTEFGWANLSLHVLADDAACEWYLMCDNPAVAVASSRAVDHPVPICQRCADKFQPSDKIPVVYFPRERKVSEAMDIEPKFTLVRAWNGDVVKIDPPYEPGLTRNVWAVHDADKECGHVHIDPDCDDCTREFTVTPGPYSGNDDILYYLLTKETWTDADKDIKYVF